MALVVDASMAMAWHFIDEITPATLAVFERTDSETMVVPQHWYAEVANALLVGQVKGRTDAPRAAEFTGRLGKLMIESEAAKQKRVFDEVLPLARAHKLTVYDAIYLELADRRDLPLATLDQELAEAAARVGVEIIGASK